MKKMKVTPVRIPTESEEQQALFSWVDLKKGAIPELELLFHIPNERKCHPATGARLKKEGVKAGVPDLCLPVPRGEYHGMYIEMKRTKKSQISCEQVQWLERLNEQGYYCVICKGWEAAKDELTSYLQLY